MDKPQLSRGGFIALTSMLGAGLGLALDMQSMAEAASASGGSFVPNVWLRIAPDETVTVMLSKSEMGQGVIMGMPTILADELDANIAAVRTEFAPPDRRYIDPELGDQATGGSTSTNSSWMPLRRAGATARAMLIRAAADRWAVEASDCSTRAGSVFHMASHRSASYGSLAVAASMLPIPNDVPLKSPDRFTLIGKSRLRTDIPAKVNGSAEYGIDVHLPGMVYAAIARSPVFGGRVKSFDARKARAIDGVASVLQISNGVAVVAKNTWAAFQGKAALSIIWDEGPNAKVSTTSLFAEAAVLARSRKGERVALERGTPSSGTIREATYRGPFLAHATMEPMNTTAHVRDGRCEVWSPTQVQLRAQAEAAAASGLPAERCEIHTTFLGGGFGRRLEADYVREAVEVAKAVRVPVKVTWTREDDIQGDFYRPMSLNVVRGVVSGGDLESLAHLVVSPSWLRRWYPHPPYFKNGIDYLDIAEVLDAPYFIPNFRVSYIDHEHGIPIGSWRAPDANWNAFVTESFIDELAHAANRDPLSFRLSLLNANPRAAALLRLAARKASWGRTSPGIAQGLALSFWAGSYAAMVAEVSLENKLPRVHRVVAAVDCGTVINPDIVIQQAQGATNFGLSAALSGKITIANGRVEQNNFYDYTVLRMKDAPAIEVHVAPSDASPTGIGELCTPPVAPAVGNALFRLTGRRVRSLPFSDLTD